MNRLLISAACAALALVGAAGCCSNCASTGWEFRVGKPATFYSPGLVQQNPGPLQVAPLGTTIPPMITGTAATPGAVRLMQTAPAVEEAPAPRRMAPADNCTCEQLLSALQRIESRLVNLSANRPLPKGPEEE